ncbi:LysR family transcriptional regulator [Sphingobium sp. SCG-1]|uniref:LysR family transcriptional regulator n=1 Tax=Sphingobium sp. SCG-1 TaxID=2072936 RepID=UPI000CD675F0|nr:LysR family transcriptional regulator [Sphingobium sp. SCG-1]AUW56761.1 LysR family transcriptional regulator [Sphingobium sp. SCG-1]
MIDRYQLRYFLAVVDNGNFSRAAAQCNVSQPTLSVGIAKLERSVGAPLFVRTNRRVQLTQAGVRFLGHARRIESEFNLAQQSLTETAISPVVRLGLLRSISGDMLSSIVAEMLRLDPDAQIEIIEGSERELTAQVARGRVDCALTLVGRGADRFLEEPLFEEGYALALPASHPLASQSVVQAEALADNVMIVRRHCEALSETSRHFTERGVRPHFAYRSTNDERVLQLVAAGLGVTVMPESFKATGVVRPRFSGFDLTRTVGLIYGAASESYAASPPALIEAARKILTVRAP